MPKVLDGSAKLDVYDPSAVKSEIAKINQERMQALKSTKIEDRDIKVFNVQSKGQNLRSFLMDLE